MNRHDDDPVSKLFGPIMPASEEAPRGRFDLNFRSWPVSDRRPKGSSRP
jgi:hypothetical protein